MKNICVGYQDGTPFPREKKILTDELILKNSTVGFEFEFFTELEDKEIVQELEKRLTNKKIVIPKELIGFDTFGIPNHSKFNPDRDNFKLERDFSGGLKMFELVTGPCPYNESIQILKTIYDFIAECGWTTLKSGIHVNVSFNKMIEGRHSLSNLDSKLFSIRFDEDFIFDRWPNRKNNVYSQSIKTFRPIFHGGVLNPLPENFIGPTSKYYGINFSKLSKNYLEMRYLGGKNYHTKFNETVECIDHFLLSLFRTLEKLYYTKDDLEKFSELIKGMIEKKIFVFDFEHFKKSRKNIFFFLDGDRIPITNEIYFRYFADFLLASINNCNFKDCALNMNMKDNILEVLKCSFKKLLLENDDYKIHFKNCSFSEGVIEHKFFSDCSIKNVILRDCEFYKCDISDCKVERCIVNDSNITNCYIDNKGDEKQFFNSEFSKCIIRQNYPLEKDGNTIDDCIWVAKQLKEKSPKRKKINYDKFKY